MSIFYRILSEFMLAYLKLILIYNCIMLINILKLVGPTSLGAGMFFLQMI